MAAGLRQWLGAACALLAALACGEAGAHAVLLESLPAADAVLAQAPEQITLRFTEPVRPTAIRLLRAADGASVELDAPKPPTPSCERRCRRSCPRAPTS